MMPCLGISYLDLPDPDCRSCICNVSVPSVFVHSIAVPVELITYHISIYAAVCLQLEKLGAPKLAIIAARVLQRTLLGLVDSADAKIATLPPLQEEEEELLSPPSRKASGNACMFHALFSLENSAHRMRR